jgi:hypothetical protein
VIFLENPPFEETIGNSFYEANQSRGDWDEIVKPQTVDIGSARDG